VLAQTDPRFVLVVADNASEDDTARVVEGFGDARIRYVRRPTDIGFAANFERSMDDVDTDYVTLLPDDDLMLPYKLERAVEVMDAHPRAGLLHARYDEIDARGAPLRRNVDPTKGRLAGDAVEPGHRFIREAIRTSRHVVFSTAFLRTAALPTPRFDPRGGLAIDLGLWLRVALDWDVAFVASPLATVRIHSTMLSSTAGFFSDRNYVQGFDMVRQARDVKLAFLREHGARFPDREQLRIEADRVARRHMLGAVWNLRTGAGRITPSIRMLGEGIRREPRLLYWPSTYGLVGAILVGPGIAEPVWSRLHGDAGDPGGIRAGSEPPAPARRTARPRSAPPTSAP
jgi:glycosyltransferase involved in cell wall biosynthesis